MKDERIKEIMAQTPYPDSLSIYLAMRQIANEVEQEVRAEMRYSHIDIMPLGGEFPKVMYPNNADKTSARG